MKIVKDGLLSFPQVFNVVPSISAVTGISPGRYLWRVVIAFHLGPRLLIVATYYHFLLTFLETAARRQGRTTKRDFYSLPLTHPQPSFLKTLKMLEKMLISSLHSVNVTSEI